VTLFINCSHKKGTESLCAHRATQGPSAFFCWVPKRVRSTSNGISFLTRRPFSSNDASLSCVPPKGELLMTD
jgi:hypothetical protein